MPTTNIVQVQFRNRYGEGYGGTNYTYIADVPLKVGDIVKVPTRYGDSEARVSRIDVPADEVPNTFGGLLHITENAVPSESAFDGFFN
jgi:hypothetical protein